jgi:glutathione S-transferase
MIIYGSPRSRTMRVLWTAAELELDYEHVPLAFDDPRLKQADYVRLNPAGTVPTIVDDGFALSESLAINLYLAKRYGSNGEAPLYPASAQDEASVWRWTLWAQSHLEPWVQQDALLADLRQAIGSHSRATVNAALAVLDAVLSERNWLVSEHFTVGDLNVASVLSPSRTIHLDLTPYRHVDNWLHRCCARPAALATRRRFGLHSLAHD